MNERMNGWLNIALSLLFILFFFGGGCPEGFPWNLNMGVALY